jgi:hypothetical protein
MEKGSIVLTDKKTALAASKWTDISTAITNRQAIENLARWSVGQKIFDLCDDADENEFDVEEFHSAEAEATNGVDQHEARIRALEKFYESDDPQINDKAILKIVPENVNDPSHIDYRDPNCYNQTKLHKAVNDEDFQAVKELVEAGANVHIECNNGWSPLATAEIEGNYEIIQFLRDATISSFPVEGDFRLESMANAS